MTEVAKEAARVWQHRERVEREAALLFDWLALELRATGAPDPIVQMARRAADDEREHAVLCRRLVDAFDPSRGPLEPQPHSLGPTSLSRVDRALYVSVAMGCVTETLSTTLLLVMRDLVTDACVKTTVGTIVKDEVAHSRLGWAHLAAAARTSDVRWLSDHVGGMLGAAMTSDLPPPGVPMLDGVGILPRDRVLAVVRDTTARVIFPGLERFGIDTRAARATQSR